MSKTKSVSKINAELTGGELASTDPAQTAGGASPVNGATSGKRHTKPQSDPDVNPVEFFNEHGLWRDCFKDIKQVDYIDELIFTFDTNRPDKPGEPEINGFYLTPPEGNTLGLPTYPLSKFQLYSRLQHKGHYRSAISQIEFTMLNKDVPYIRVGVDYFKIIEKIDRYDVTRRTIKKWKKEEMKQDHGAKIMSKTHLFDDFTIIPDNTHHCFVHQNCYNVYAPMSHRPVRTEVTEDMIPYSIGLLRHIFQEQFDMGLTYFKVLYEMPRQALPILCLVSEKRGTGKTTVINWLDMIFGDNFILIAPEDLSKSFNSGYTAKNVIAIDEAVVGDRSTAIEKLKSLSTAKSINVNRKFIDDYSLPFFGKFVLCTNKEKDFIRIDEDEIRFWVRKIKVIPNIITDIEKHLAAEIPAFLKYLTQLPPVDTTKSRMIFTAEQLANEQLKSVKGESWSSLRKEIYMHFQDFFLNYSGDEVRATSGDIKSRWFSQNHNYAPHYITKVVQDEMKSSESKVCRYTPFDSDPNFKRVGRAFVFKRADFLDPSDPDDLVEPSVTDGMDSEPPF